MSKHLFTTVYIMIITRKLASTFETVVYALSLLVSLQYKF